MSFILLINHSCTIDRPLFSNNTKQGHATEYHCQWWKESGRKMDVEHLLLSFLDIVC